MRIMVKQPPEGPEGPPSGYGQDHLAMRSAVSEIKYDGPPCVTCGEPTVCFTVGAPGYGSGRACVNGHDEWLTSHGEFTLDDVR